MEKIFLKPIAKEISFSPAEPNTVYDSFEYTPRDEKTKHLGHLYVIGHLKHGEENMAYVLNLVSSLAKREYYSENGPAEENPKKAFDHTLKKLNNVLEDFFENKEFQIDLGLVALAGENIHIAKLGKFKILLARSGEIIDILNNVDLFQREPTEEKKFSSVISGKIQDGDKLFALYPTRSLSAREKSLKLALAKNSQEEFLEGLSSLSQTAKNFSCGGFHIEVKKVTEAEIPVRSAYEVPVIQLATAENTEDLETAEEKAESSPALQKNMEKEENNNQPTKAKLISSADVSVVKRQNILEKIQERLTPRRSFRSMNQNRSWKAAALGMVVLLAAVWGVKMVFFQNSPDKAAVSSAQDNLKLAQTKISQNQNDSARELLGLSLTSLANFNTKKANDLKTQINTLMDRLDLVSDKQPQLFSAFSNAATTINKILISKSGDLVAINQDKKAFKISTNSQTAANVPDLIINTDSNKMDIYENNVYVLDGKAIYKYNDGLTGGTSKQLWLGGLTDSDPIDIAVDGNVYVLSSDGTVIKYFKAKQDSKINLNTKISGDSKIIISKDSPYIYLADFTNKKVRVFDKTTGSLVMTYKVSNLPAFTDMALGNKTLYLSGDNQVWKIDLN